MTIEYERLIKTLYIDFTYKLTMSSALTYLLGFLRSSLKVLNILDIKATQIKSRIIHNEQIEFSCNYYKPRL